MRLPPLMTLLMPLNRSSVARRPPAVKKPPAKKNPSSVDEGLHFGLQLRHYRLMRKLKLKELAEMADCSESLLSRIENNQINPSFAMLHRLCKALDTTVASMMAPIDAAVCHVTRPGERPVVGRSSLRDVEKSEAEVFVPYTDGRLLEGVIVILEPGGNSNGVLSHRGEEVGYVLEGQLELTVDTETYLLDPGCTFFFRSDIPHSYLNPGERTTRIVWVNTPPSF
jgi:transcriptional regulator with XRE-family HTH domain